MRKISNSTKVFIFLGIIALIVGCISLKKRNEYLPADAKIIKIEEHRGTDEKETTYEVTVSYEINGVGYEGTMGDYQPSFEEGKIIEIRYDKNDPHNITGTSLGFIIYLLVLGPVLIALGVFFLFKDLA